MAKRAPKKEENKAPAEQPAADEKQSWQVDDEGRLVDDDGNEIQLFTAEDVEAAAAAARSEGYDEGHADGVKAAKSGKAPKAAPKCTNGAKVQKGQVVQFWHPKNGAQEELIHADVVDVHKVEGGPPLLTLSYPTRAGVQQRERVQYLEDPTLKKRTGRWFEFGRRPIAKAKKGE